MKESTKATVRATFVAALLCTAPGTAQGAPPTVKVSDPDNLVAIQVPKSWVIQARKFGKLGEAIQNNELIYLRAKVLGVLGTIEIWVDVLNASQPRPLAQAWYEAHSPVVQAHNVDPEIFEKPIVHKVSTDKKHPKFRRVVAFRRVRGRGLHVSVFCRADSWPEFKKEFFQLAASATATYGPWPKGTPKRPITVVKGVGYTTGAGVTKRQLRAMQKLVARIEKPLVKLHGPRPTGPEPLVVHINAFSGDHKRFPGTGDDPANVFGDSFENRVFTVPLGDSDTAERRRFVYVMTKIFISQIYGSFNPPWTNSGEQIIAMNRDATGRALPYVRAATLSGLDKTTATFADMLAFDVRNKTREHHAFAYTALFHIGPGTYRKAYSAFLADLRKTLDADAATKKHLLVLDQEKMLEDAQAIMKRLKAPKQR